MILLSLILGILCIFSSGMTLSQIAVDRLYDKPVPKATYVFFVLSFITGTYILIAMLGMK